MHGICSDPLALSNPGQLLGEVDIGQLAATVREEGQQVVVQVLEIQLLVLVVVAGECYHSAWGRLFQTAEQQVGQEEVAEVVHTETHAEVVISPVKNTGHA